MFLPQNGRNYSMNDKVDEMQVEFTDVHQNANNSDYLNHQSEKSSNLKSCNVLEYFILNAHTISNLFSFKNYDQITGS
jgi:hypothetical protein